MHALIYKCKQLLKCKQQLSYCCNSSNGRLVFNRNRASSFIPNPIYDVYQKNVVLKNKYIPIKKICSWNIQELWWHSYAGNKISNIIEYISNCDTDVLCIQEAFDPNIQHILVNHPKIKKKFPFFLTGNLYNSYIIGENSGLFVLSKQPIVFKQFTPFSNAAWPDNFASKGALYFTIGDINFITTHLQSENIPLAFKQLNTILQNLPFRKKTVLLGDLNIPNPYDNLNLTRCNIRHTHTSGTTLDHIIPLFCDITLDINIDYIDLKNTSDHWPIFATIN